MIEIKGLHKAFGQNQVLKGVDITVNKGDVVVVIGSSGSGKTTMLRCINFLERADAGRITVGDITVDAAIIFIIVSYLLERLFTWMEHRMDGQTRRKENGIAL